MLERLWATWRSHYVQGIDESPNSPPEGKGSVFERILSADMPDEQALVVHRGPQVSVMLNAYPYGSGHLLVMPNRAVEKLTELSAAEALALWATVDHAVAVVEHEYQAPGINMGLNQGRAAGAGLPDHLHVHVLPRWSGDTNFMTSIAESRVLPESLPDTWKRLHVAWGTMANRLDP